MYNLEVEGCPLICRFSTMGAVRSIQHSKIGKDISCLPLPSVLHSGTDMYFFAVCLPYVSKMASSDDSVGWKGIKNKDTRHLKNLGFIIASSVLIHF